MSISWMKIKKIQKNIDTDVMFEYELVLIYIDYPLNTELAIKENHIIGYRKHIANIVFK